MVPRSGQVGRVAVSVSAEMPTSCLVAVHLPAPQVGFERLF